MSEEKMETVKHSAGSGTVGPGGRAGMTLLELLGVMAVIAILASMLLGTVAGVRRHARRVAARAEVKQLESAWKQYYSEYRRWPDFAAEGVPVAMTGTVARALEGETGTANPRGIGFMDFSRYDVGADPVNPWGYADRVAAGVYYHAQFDVDHDHLVSRAGTNAYRRSVIVWTVEPGAGLLIGSWD